MANDQNYVNLSRQLRKNQTPWEVKLWARLKNRKFLGLKFKRQVVIGQFIYDFSCFESKLIIELDGSQHKLGLNQQQDKIKEGFAKNLGYKVLRFNNNDIDGNMEGVLETIRLAV